MLSLVALEYLFGLLVLVVFANRYVLGSLLRLSDRRTRDSFGEDPLVWPTVAIVVPVYNEGASILRTAESFDALDYPRDRLQVLFVDDVSTDDTGEHLQTVAASYGWMKVFRNEQNMGKRLGIKNAVLQSRADLILSVDSDVIVDHGALRTLVRHLLGSGADAMGGCVFVSNADQNWLTRMQAVKYWIGYQFLKNLENTFSHVMCLSGCLTLYRRSALLAVDRDIERRSFLGDEVKYGEDRFLTRKLVERGYRTRLCFEAVCFTKAPASLQNYFSQQLRWRRSNIIDFITAIPFLARFHPLVLVHYMSMAMLLFFYPLMLAGKVARLGFVIPMMEHALLVTVFAAAYELRKHKLPEMARTSGVWFLSMAFVFPVMYLITTPLALATLGTTSWETRGPQRKRQPDAQTAEAVS
ncbi:MAG: glycosyltransferase family 2 protein [Proteobacteria bacterium]|nr:glycosyltransferase family 2 protein [Pseudomonadota bacterium]